VVNGNRSNSLPFTVRSGNIYFVKTNGNDDTGDGSWSRPWHTIPKAVNTIAPGDIAYICNGVNQTTETDYCKYSQKNEYLHSMMTVNGATTSRKTM